MILFNLFAKVKNKNALWKEKEISVLLKGREKILDYGCGDLLLARELKRTNKNLEITGVDVVSAPKVKDIKFVKYDGKRLPFKDKTFETIVSVYVFHHCVDAEEAFTECVRVAKKRVVFIEAIAKSRWELLPMSLMDWFFNVWKPEPIPLTYQFKTLKEWKKIFKKLNLKIKTGKVIKNPIAVLPVSDAYLFEVWK